MEFFETIRTRCAVRGMDPTRAVEQEKLEAILEAGRTAPTAKNMQPQRIYVLRSPEALQMAEELTICTFHAPVILVICADRDEAWKHYLTGETRAETDAAIVTTHMMLAAHALGLGSTWVARFDTALAAESKTFAVNSGLESSRSENSTVCKCSSSIPVLPFLITLPPCGIPE